MSFSPTIEILEDRIAPATIVNPTTITYQDIDGDHVVLKFSAPVFTSTANAKTLLSFSTGTSTVWNSNATPESLDSINLTGQSGLKGLNISVSVVPQAGVGNGQADVGAIIAGTLDSALFTIDNGIDLGTVKIQGNLGYIVAGDTTVDPAIASLTVKNFGEAKGGTGLQTGFTESSILGQITSLHTTGDMVGFLHLYGGVYSSISNLKIDGALDGSVSGQGAIQFNGTLGKATIGSIVGGSGDGSGLIFAEVKASPARINSLHVLGSITGGAGANSGEVLVNSIGSIQVDGDVTGLGKASSTSNSGVINAGSIGSVKIIGSLAGGVGDSTGLILANQVNSIQIGGSLTGSTGASSAEISVTKLGSLKIGGNLVGNSGSNSAFVTGSQLGSLDVGGSLLGGGGSSSGSILVPSIGSVSVKGSLVGGNGQFSGTLEAITSLGNTKIGGSLQGGAGIQSGFLHSGTSTGAGPSVSIGGSLNGGSDEYSGSLSGNAFSKISIRGSVNGGSGTNSGAVLASLSVGSITIGGDLVGGTGANNSNVLSDSLSGVSGAVVVKGALGNLKIAGNVTGAGSSDSAISQSGYISANHIGNLAIGGSLIAGAKGANSISDSGAIRAGQDIGKLIIGGDLNGDATNPAVISAGGFLGQNPAAKTDLAINKIVIGGGMTHAAIVAGYTDGTDTAWGNEFNPDAQINSVIIGGDLTASNIVAGVSAGKDGAFGTSDDKAISTNTSIFFALPQVVSKISSIVVGGNILSDQANANATFGIEAQNVVAVKASGNLAQLTPGASNDIYPGIVFGTNTHILEIA